VTATRFQLGTRSVDLDLREVRQGEAIAPLTANEASLLSLLVARAGQPVSRDELLIEGLRYRKAVHTRAVDQAVWRLRKKLEDEPHRPVFLRSEPNVGYWLVLEPARAPSPIGRGEELRALRRWLTDDPREVWIVGSAGMGRRTLAAQLGDLGAAVRIETRMPADPSVRVLRLGPLPDETATTLLVDQVLTRRGTIALGEGEGDVLPALVAAVGGHPASLIALADASVLHSLPELAQRPEPPRGAVDRLLVLVRDLPPEAQQAAAALAVVPDGLPASEAVALLGPSVVEAWRASALEAADRDTGRWFVVLPAVRAALDAAGIVAAPEAVERLVGHLAAGLRALDDAYGATGSASARDELRERAATVRWLVAHTRDPALLSVLLTADPVPPADLPLPDPGDDVDARVCLGAIAANRVEWRDPAAWVAEIEALQPLRPSPSLALRVLQWQVVASIHTGGPLERAEAALARMEQVTEQLGTPFARAFCSRARGQVEMHEGWLARADASLLGALRLFEELGADHHAETCRSQLAYVALLDGRSAEGIAWAERVLRHPTGTVDEEALKRMHLVELLIAEGQLDDARRQLALVEALGFPPAHLELDLAWCDLVEGHPERAQVRTLAVAHLPTKPAGIADLVLTWSHLLRGDVDGAVAQLDALEAVWQARAIDLDWLRIVVSAADGRPGEAQRQLDAVSEPVPRWWARAREAGAAWIAHATGDPVDAMVLAEAYARDTHRDVGLQLAIDALVGAARNKPQQGAGGQGPGRPIR
jgi:DNA-binding winged helix-turn-helix (wHTH) protein